jgi:hypothetical protein
MKGGTMKKVIWIIFLTVLLFPAFSYAAGPCADIEYAELQDMDEQALITEYCNAKATGKSNAYLSMGGSRQATRDMESCLALIKKMERIFKKRFPDILDPATKCK